MIKRSVIDVEHDKWHKKMFGDGSVEPEWKEQKKMFAEHLVATKPKSWIWKQLCGPATGPCRCNCMCSAGIAWNAILEREAKEGERNDHRKS